MKPHSIIITFTPGSAFLDGGAGYVPAVLGDAPAVAGGFVALHFAVSAVRVARRDEDVGRLSPRHLAGLLSLLETLGHHRRVCNTPTTKRQRLERDWRRRALLPHLVSSSIHQ